MQRIFNVLMISLLMPTLLMPACSSPEKGATLTAMTSADTAAASKLLEQLRPQMATAAFRDSFTAMTGTEKSADLVTSLTQLSSAGMSASDLADYKSSVAAFTKSHGSLATLFQEAGLSANALTIDDLLNAKAIGTAFQRNQGVLATRAVYIRMLYLSTTLFVLSKNSSASLALDGGISVTNTATTNYEWTSYQYAGTSAVIGIGSDGSSAIGCGGGAVTIVPTGGKPQTCTATGTDGSTIAATAGGGAKSHNTPFYDPSTGSCSETTYSEPAVDATGAATVTNAQGQTQTVAAAAQPQLPATVNGHHSCTMYTPTSAGGGY